MKIETKYNIDQRVWVCETGGVFMPEFTCPVCKGSGKSVLNSKLPCNISFDVRYKCRNGWVGRTQLRYKPVECKVCEIWIHVNDFDEVCIEYEVSSFVGEYAEDSIFATLEEAQEECDRRNARDEQETC